MKAEKE